VPALPLQPKTSRNLSAKHCGGLQGFIVDVEGFNEQSTSLRSASQSQVQTDVELRVRKAGIQLSTENEWPNSLYHPAIIVNLRLFSLEKHLEDVYTYNITVKVMQDVRPMAWIIRERDGNEWKKSIWATTWDKGITGAITKNQLGALRNQVNDLVDQFINDYLAANRKR